MENSVFKELGPETKDKNPLILGLAVLGLAVIAFAYFTFFSPTGLPSPSKKVSEYVIPNVPPLSVYDSEMFNGLIGNSEEIAMLTILRYWGEEAPLYDRELRSDILSVFPNWIPDVDKMREFYTSRGYHFEINFLSTPEQLANYINTEKRIPLLFSQPVDPTDPRSFLFKVLIGIKDNGRTVVIHDTHKGNNYELSYKDFEDLWKVYDYPWYIHRYFIISPTDEKRVEVIKNKVASPYPERLAIMNRFEPPLTSLMHIFLADDKSALEKQVQGLLNDPLFNDLHPRIKTSALTVIANKYAEFGDYKNVLPYLNKALEVNHDLDKQYGEWPLFVSKELFLPYTSLATYYNAIGDKKSGAENATKAEALLTEWRTALQKRFRPNINLE